MGSGVQLRYVVYLHAHRCGMVPFVTVCIPPGINFVVLKPMPTCFDGLMNDTKKQNHIFACSVYGAGIPYVHTVNGTVKHSSARTYQKIIVL